VKDTQKQKAKETFSYKSLLEHVTEITGQATQIWAWGKISEMFLQNNVLKDKKWLYGPVLRL
jgi:hypothetical protein